jgi:hypothetical protein
MRTNQPLRADPCICEHRYDWHTAKVMIDGKIRICEVFECMCEKFVFKHNPLTQNQ